MYAKVNLYNWTSYMQLSVFIVFILIYFCFDVLNSGLITPITGLHPLKYTTFITSTPEILKLECIVRNVYTSASVSANVTVIGEYIAGEQLFSWKFL